jgi:predicted MPP superfamily phosphohydrolase
MLDRQIFPRFIRLLASAGGFAEWILVCWILAPYGVHPTRLEHLLGALTLLVVNMVPACRLERDVASAKTVGRLGRGILAFGFTASVAVAALIATGGAWSMFRAFGALQVEAGVVAAAGSEPLFGHDFRLLGLAVVTFVGSFMGYGYLRGYRSLGVTHVRVPVLNLPPALAGLRIVQVSDLHLGPLADRASLREAFDRVVALDPDLVCLTGDIVDAPQTDLDEWLPELHALSARHGVFAILGNHDVRTGADEVADAMRRLTPCRLLRDEVATVTVADSALHLIGLEDFEEDPDAALPELLEQIPPGAPTILLAHRPTVFPAASAAGITLTLSGHTHGGQLAVPFFRRANLARLGITRFDQGRFVENGCVLYVTRGLGTSGQRVRVGAPPEVVVLTLVAAEASAA